MKPLLLLLAALCFNSVFAQRLEIINYVVKDTTEGEIREDKWPHYRTYLNDSIYCEEAFFSVNGSRYDVIKKVGSDWYLFNNGSWECFYCNGTARSIVVDRGYRKGASTNSYKLEWDKKIQLCKLDVWVFYFKPVGFTLSEIQDYYFSPELGVIGWGKEKPKTLGLEGLIIREDVKQQGDCAKCFFCDFKE
jgi:hypothetical protein